MSALAPDAFERRLDGFLQERSEEARAVRVGEKDTSEQAAIVARYADLFTRGQLAALEEAEDAADGADREVVARLRLTCQEGIVTRELAEREDALENALLAARVAWDGDDCRSAPRRPDSRSSRTTRAGTRSDAPSWTSRRASTTSGGRCSSTATSSSRRNRGSSIRLLRNEKEKGVSLRPILDAVDRARVESTPSFTPSREHWLDRLLGSERDTTPVTPTSRGSGGSPRSRRRTRRSGASRSALRRCRAWASTSSPSRGSVRTSRTGHRSHPVRA